MTTAPNTAQKAPVSTGLLESYSDLIDTVADYLNRVDLKDNVPTFIRMAETDFDRRVRHPLMMKNVAAQVTEGYVPLPDDLVETYTIDIPSFTRRAIEFIPAEAYRRMSHAQRNNGVIYCSLEGNQINFLGPPPKDGSVVNLRYYAQVPRLGPLVSSNWLLRKYPDAYLYGTLFQSAVYTGDDNNLSQWAQIISGLIDAIRKANDDARFPSSSLTMKARAF